MTHNRSFTGPAEAIERAKNSGDDMIEKAESTYASVSESAHQAYDETMDTARQYAHDAYDSVGEAFRASEDYVRREPLRAVAVAAAIGLVVGYCFAVRSAPISASRKMLSRWS
jgi:ElaB/YqjD/DUF883 family membrane-anchored ribosome-binding protein